MYRDTVALLIFTAVLAVVAITAFLCMPAKQELGWLAQRQIQARHECADILKYRMQW